MGQRPKPMTKAQIIAAQAKYAEDVAAGRRLPLPDLGLIRSAEGDWRPVAGEGYAIVKPRRQSGAPRARGVNFNPLALRGPRL